MCGHRTVVDCVYCFGKKGWIFLLKQALRWRFACRWSNGLAFLRGPGAKLVYCRYWRVPGCRLQEGIQPQKKHLVWPVAVPEKGLSREPAAGSILGIRGGGVLWAQRDHVRDPLQHPLPEPLVGCLAKEIPSAQHETSAFILLTLWLSIFLMLYLPLVYWFPLFSCHSPTSVATGQVVYIKAWNLICLGLTIILEF